MPHAWEADLADAAAEIEHLDVDQLTAEARAAAVELRAVGFGSTFFLPLPLVAQDVPSIEGEWATSDDPDATGLVGLDAAGRPVLHLLDAGTEWERTNHVWRWDDDGSFFEFELMGSGPHVRRARVENGDVVSVATASAHGSRSVRLVEWCRGVAVGVVEAARWKHGGSDAAVAARIRGGEVEQLWSARRDAQGELADGLRHAAKLEPDHLAWDGRVLRPEPWPGDAEAQHLVEPLAVALDRALRRAASRSGIEQPFVLEVRSGPVYSHDSAAFPPFARVAGTQWRDGMRRASRRADAALSLYDGVDSGLVAQLDLVDDLDDAALRACRVLSTRLRADWTAAESAVRIGRALGDRLAHLLNAVPLAGAADPFLALVHLGEDDERGALAFSRAVAATGPAHVTRFRASLAPLPQADGTTVDAAERERARVDRNALEAVIAGTPLTAHAHRLAHEVAAEGLRLVPAPDERGAPAGSRLGGPPVVPEGAGWPTTAVGRPLTFLAAIDLAELPEGEVAAKLPRRGWLLFFAEMMSDSGDGLIDVADNAPGSVARVFFAETVAAAQPPAALRDVDSGILEHRRVVAEPELSLPTHLGAADDLGLDAFEATAYEELVDALGRGVGAGADGPQVDDVRVAEDDVAWADDDDGEWEDAGEGAWANEDELWRESPLPRHWIGGLQTGVQGHPPSSGTTLLLHLADDDGLGFGFLDAGAIQFRIPDAALAARDWSQAFAEADSC